MPDALIRTTIGDEPLEVVTASDSEYLRLQDALTKQGRTLDLNPEEPAWEITRVHKTANLRNLRRRLPGLIRQHEAELQRDELPSELQRLGVEDAQQLLGRSGFIHFSAAGWNSWDYDTEFGKWLDGFFAHASDVPYKLARHGGKKQHAFIWAASLAAWSVLTQLELDGEDHPQLPQHEPAVPGTLTDIGSRAPSFDRHGECCTGSESSAGHGLHSPYLTLSGVSADAPRG